MTNEELGKYLARKLFECGSLGPSRPCTRIVFKTGEWRNNTERDMGGFAEKPLAEFFAEILNKVPK